MTGSVLKKEAPWRGENYYGGTQSNGIKLTKGKGLLNTNNILSVFLWHCVPREVSGAPSF